MKKVIIISHEPLTSKTKENFYINDLIENKIEIEYWDISYILHGKKVYINGEIFDKYILKLKTIEDLEININKQNNKDLKVIVELINTPKTKYVYKILSDYNLDTYAMDMYGCIDLPIKERLRYFKSYGIKKIKYFVRDKFENQKNKYYFKKNNIKGIKTWFCPGSISIDKHKKTNNIVPINHFDYDIYIKSLNQERLLKERYCVFLDQYLPYHPDFKMLKTKTLNPEKYYSSLEKFFDYIENTYKVSVVIAAHPKSDYNKHNIFKKYKIIKYKTDILVRHSEFVILHDSLSMNYAILGEKPMVFIYTKELKNLGTSIYPRIEYFSKMFDIDNYNIDDKNEYCKINIKKINKDKYIYYKYNYLTNKSTENMSTGDILLKYIKES